MKLRYCLLIFLYLPIACVQSNTTKESQPGNGNFYVVHDETAGTISIYREGATAKPVLVQNAKADFRPYLHPLEAPDGKGILTEYSPAHHKHQTGIYWGLTRVNGRDFFHNPGGDYWKRNAVFVSEKEGQEVKWQTVYDMLDENGHTLLTETQKWSFREDSERYVMTLEWRGDAKTDVTIGKYDYGGLFIRMPWKEGMEGEVMNSVRQKNEQAEGKQATWVDVGMQVEGREDWGHIAVFDHPNNKGYPQHWRVDGQLGIGPAPAREKDIQIKNGESETIRHQLVVYTGDLDDAEISRRWAVFTGNENALYATAMMWKIAQNEGLHAKFLTPQEAVAAMTVKKGYRVNVWAAEPLMTQPMAFCWDDKGRLWIAENRDYESRGHGFSNAGDSRILILEDTDGDGIADTRKVFMEGLAFPAAIAVGFDGVFIGAPPNLLFVPDRDHDDKADMDNIEVRLTGWGIADRHETLNSLHWGPDGWLYGCQGFATPSKVRKPQGEGRLYKHKDPFPEDILQGNGVDINGGVWRYHPTKDIFEVVAHGFSNPWGIDYDAKGQLFISACVIPHMWHVIPGGIYHRQGGQHFNPYVYEDIKTITNHSHRSAHGGARIYQSDAFPASQQDRIFMANIHEHAVLSDILLPKGSGFVARHGDDFLMANNAQWVGFSMEIGPDGGLYALDWHDADICGQKVLNSETGRIFRIMPEKSGAENWEGRYADLSNMSDAQLVALQTSKSDWHTRRARVILQARAADGKLQAGTAEEILKLYRSASDVNIRLKALWTLHITGSLPPTLLQQSLNDKEEYIRAWAIQLLCEDKNPSSDVKKKFASMAAADRSPVVRLYLASAMQRTDKETAWKIAEGLLKHEEDITDHNLPKMTWFGLEPLVKEDPARALKLASRSKIPLIAHFTARRAVDGNALDALVGIINERPPMLDVLLEGMMNGMEGRTDITPPAGWAKVYATHGKRNDATAALVNQVADMFGDSEAAQRALAALKNKTAGTDQRKKALQTLALQQREELAALLPELLNDPQLRTAAIRSIAAFDRRNLGTLLVNKYKSLNEEDKAAAIQTLSSRPTYGWMLTQEIKNGNIPKKEISANAARQMRRVVGSGFVEVWGPIDDKPRDEKQYKKYRDLMSNAAAEKADINHGQAVFATTCGSCHKMFGKGGIVGPDLTGSNRSDLEYLLFNILDPSEEIQDDYKMVVITTRDGRTYSGNIVGENQRQITMRQAGQDDVIISKSAIQSKEVTDSSLMPQGLLTTLSEKEIIDLLHYLQVAVK